MIDFKDSGMHFRFPDGECYKIEDDPLVSEQKTRSTNANKSCECVAYIDGHHYFIEAKSSVPRKERALDADSLRIEHNGIYEPVPEQWEVYNNFDSFLRQISKKFIDAFYLLKSISENRATKGAKRTVTLSRTKVDYDKVKFILIINFPARKSTIIDEDSLSNLMDAIKAEMRPFLNIWGIRDTSIKVVLPDVAKKGLHIPIC